MPPRRTPDGPTQSAQAALHFDGEFRAARAFTMPSHWQGVIAMVIKILDNKNFLN
jgi:hypothetical protein